MTCKVSRYRESATVLVQAARKFPRLRNMKIDLAELPADAFSRPTISSDHRPSIYSTISRCKNNKYSPKEVKRMCDLLKLSPEKASTRYIDGVKDNLENSKVHAEIQLVYYCQTMLKGKAPLPRVICSILYAGKAKIEYRDPIESDLSTLKLPSERSNSSELLDGVSSENKLQQLNATLNDIPRSPKRITTAQQYETTPEEEAVAEDATLETHANSECHTSNSLVPVKVSGILAQGKQPNVAVYDNLESFGQIVTENRDGTILKREMLPEDGAIEDRTISENRSSVSLVSTVVLVVPPPACASSEGTSREPQEKAGPYNITPGEISPVYSSGPLQLQFEYTSANWQQKRSENSRKWLSCTTEWLLPKYAEQFKLEGMVAIDTESLTREEIPHGTDASNNIYLRLGEAVLRVTMNLCDKTNSSSESRD
ncbi:hypothetical protein GQX73_g6967 [Xylaria multiplex]|uniref:Uncharacterized protein n=1 Tax=Xylaria multiplex TaxID=323545 RepID=A0A7C8MMI5_9PEZI|nr:hypothetical protein GQX73_g6967 [Xylaria multiplex]